MGFQRFLGLMMAVLQSAIVFSVTPKTSGDVKSVLVELDSVIAHAQQYEAKKKVRLESLRKQLSGAQSLEARYQLNMQLYKEYRSYQNDSALAFLSRNLTIARRQHNADREANCLSLMAYQSASVGRYPDAELLLARVNANGVSRQTLYNYYTALHYIASEESYYSGVKRLRDSLAVVAGQYEGKLFALADKRSPAYKELLCSTLFNNNQLDAAMRVNDDWLAMTPDSSREFALVAYYRFLIFNAKGDVRSAEYWAARSAICDVRHAVMDQGSLWSLADMISGSDINRSYSYIRYSWQCSLFFGTNKRTAQISPVLGNIELAYQKKLHEANVWLVIISSCAVLLAITALLMLFYSNKQRHNLAAARNSLKHRNDQLQESNLQIKASSERLAAVNAQLYEADQVKEAYIAHFFAICSDYIDRMDEMRKHTNRMIKAHQVDELYQMTRSTEQKDKDIEKLYDHFDSTFLNLFPTFVDDFNALLRPESRITPPADGKLNTILRIFALIRLGFDDSGKIAEFLRYSVNTIYNYRARTKNGALSDRDNFEQNVKNLGRIK